MTLKKLAFYIASISLITGFSAQARNPGPVPGTDQRSIVLHQRYINTGMDLRSLLGLGSQFEGYEVTSVVVDVHGSMQNTQMHLVVNDRSVDRIFTPVGRVFFRPRADLILGENVRTLGLYIEGLSDIDAVTVNLSRVSEEPPTPPAPPEEVSVPMDVFRRLHGNDRLEVSDYVDLTQYRGFKITAIEIAGRANENVAQLDFVINDRGDNGGSVQLSPQQQVYTIIPRDAVIRSNDVLSILNRGDINVDTVTLKLSR